ncbi:PAS domain-containing protein [Spirosoma taeanense]|uniref:histidine kinase n=1 Tax=Spirosoma taeanense TaxID=2735870 RepID=A0A6M5Y9L8_9BACT|nr:PAS domain-containing protein [Spirosoma taeanense]QJW90655.1 PAS domain-containing protein [Spirosoma taeanense]
MYTEVIPSEQSLIGGGEMGTLIRGMDWSQTSVGPISAWPQSLRIAVQLILDTSFGMYLVWGPDQIQFYNDSFRPILGSSKHPSALGGCAKDTFSEIWDWLGPKFEGVMRGEAFSAEDLLVPLNRNGYLEDCYFTFSYSPFRDETGQIRGILVPVTETTQTVRARKRTEESQQQLHSLFEQAPMAICILRGPTFVVEMANPPMRQIWRRPTGELLGRPLFDVLTETANEGHEEMLSDVMTTGKSVTVADLPFTMLENGQLKTLYGSAAYQPLREPDGTIDRVMCVVTETTNAVQARHKLEESEVHFRHLADLVPQILWTARPDGFIDYYNQQWYTYTGFEKGYGDQSWIPILHPDDVQPCLDTYYHAIRTGQLYQIEYRFADRRNPGTYRWFLGRATPVRDASGTIIRWFGTCTDIDDQKRLSELLETRVAERTQELKTANHNLERSNFDLMQFASVASHDLKEPLRKIQAFGNILSSTVDGKLNDTELDYFHRMINASNRMQGLVDDVLNLSKLSNQALFCAETDINAVISRITDDLEMVIREKSARVTVSSLPLLEANTGQIHQLFQNLISNALKFSRGPSPAVTIGAKPVSPADAIRFSIYPDQYACIDVQDNGIGFDDAYREKIFGIFQRLHGIKFGGTGIGLAICKKIVENHRGFIYADGHPNEGATFTILLPFKQH